MASIYRTKCVIHLRNRRSAKYHPQFLFHDRNISVTPALQSCTFHTASSPSKLTQQYQRQIICKPFFFNHSNFSSIKDSDQQNNDDVPSDKRCHGESKKKHPHKKDDSSSSLFQNFLVQLKSPPNILTSSRILLSPVLGYLVISGNYETAVIGCVYCGFTDYLDGFIAKRYDMSTVLGTYLDPLADKIIINVLSVSLWYNGMLPTPLVVLWFARDLGLCVATYVYVRSNTQKGQRVIDPVTTPLKVEPTLISKVNTVLQFLTLTVGLVQPMYGMPTEYLTGLCWLTGGTTLASGFSYIGNDAFGKSGNSVQARVRQQIGKLPKPIHSKKENANKL
mmetsp:Transcript_11495/g.16089  ORF Transcript_11495/g.16089 Transcript_11495/m.16089 type:complete len:335 (-) Transcript_11495:128-1132(-)